MASEPRVQRPNHYTTRLRVGLHLYIIYLLLHIVFNYSLTLSFRAQTLPFLQILRTVAFLFFFGTDSTNSRNCLTNTSERIRFSLFSFPVFRFLVVGFRAVD